MSRPQLPGEVQADEVTRLKRQIVGLEAELAEAQNQLKTLTVASRDSLQVIAAMRKMYQPQFDLMRLLFGEISRVDAGAVTGAGATAMPGGRDPRWESWRSKLPPRKWLFLEALLDHGEMTAKQLSAALHIPRMNTVSQIAWELKEAQLIRKNGNTWALVELP